MPRQRLAPQGISDDRPAILVIAASHGFPPTQARFARVAELLAGITARGAAADLVLLLERPLQPQEAEALEAAAAPAREIDLVPHPASSSSIFRAILRACEAISFRPRLGGGLHCPRRLLGLLRVRQAERDYRAVVACGAHLARSLEVFPEWTERLIDIPWVGSDVHRSHVEQGRSDAFEGFAGGEREISLLERAGAVLVSSKEDAVRLRELGFRGELILAPPAGLEAGAPGLPLPPPDEPLRPPRILCVASETTANLDGIRWFRRQVFPQVVRAVPTCRLRIVGEAARHIEPGPGVDRVGWVDRLGREYRDAAIVALPIRMGSGTRRRAVEALRHGKLLATTPLGARGTGLIPGRDAIIADSPARMAMEIAAAFSSDALRRACEARAREAALERFDLEKCFAPLAEHLGLGIHSIEAMLSRGPGIPSCAARTPGSPGE